MIDYDVNDRVDNFKKIEKKTLFPDVIKKATVLQLVNSYNLRNVSIAQALSLHKLTFEICVPFVSVFEINPIEELILPNPG